MNDPKQILGEIFKVATNSMKTKELSIAHYEKAFGELQFVFKVSPDDHIAIEKAREQVNMAHEAMVDQMIKTHHEYESIKKKIVP